MGPPSGSGSVVINEIHYDPDVKTEQVEFIELYNPATTAVNVSGWALTGGVEYQLPASTSIPPQGYLVIAENPTALRAKFGVSALGPWVGSLENAGEKVVLRDAAGGVVDETEYQLGFPWPTVGDSPGYSIELVNPSFDNDLGGNWRVSVVGGPVTPEGQTLVAAESPWKYFKGLTEASSPTTAWRQINFDDSGWSEGDAPVGYGENWLTTRLDDMRDGYTSVFFRKVFNVDDPSELGELTLEVQYDDGFKAWINGVNVVDGNANLPAGELAFDRTASSALEDLGFRTFAVPALGSALLVPGKNVLAIQGHNASLGGSSDFFIDARLTARLGGSSTRGPTPGAQNSVFATNVAPQIRQVTHSPRQPKSGQVVTVTAKITDPEGVTSAELRYQVVEPGNYIELSDAAYTANWTTLPMNDAGTGGDEVAGDSAFTVELPPSLQQHRRLIRFRVAATDGAGLTVQVPYADDPQPNFAYFVYDEVPAWTGAVQPGRTPMFTVEAGEMSRLPVYHLISKRSEVEDCTWFSRYGGDQYLWMGTFVYDGDVYDHIRFRARGGVWRYAMVKNMWKFRFNRGHEFQARDNWGQRFKTKWTRLNLGASIQQGDYQHRGEQGMFESVGFRLFDLAGVEAPHTAFVTLRIIDDPQEADPSDQYESDFWGVYLVTEQIDGRFLDEHGLPDGNLYKMENGTGPSGANGELKNQGPDQVTDTSDLVAFRALAEGANNRSDDWWRQNLDLPRYYSYQAIIQAIHHYDVCCGKNYYYLNNPATGHWQVHPWDLDLTWADNMYVGGVGGGTEPFRSRVLSDFSNSPSRPALMLEFRNRVRELRDLLFNTDQAWRLIDEYAALLRGPGTGSNILDADRAMWDYNPKMSGGTYSSASSKAGQGRFYQAGTPTKDFAGMVQLMKNYVQYRASTASLSPAGSGLDGLARDPGIPTTPTITATGPQGFPLNRLSFRASAYTGAHAFAERMWRIAEITPAGSPAADPAEPHKYEIEPTWMSAPIISAGERDITIPASAVRVGATYRVRCRVEDTTGRQSHWSAPVEFVVGALDAEAALVENLRVTEVMYNPPQGSEFEFVELHNQSDTVTLDLGGVHFSSGIDFAFAPGTLLPPDGYLLVVQATNANDFVAFRQHYGLDTSTAVAGPYVGSLGNAGEQLTLKAGQAGQVISSLRYGDGRGWPLAADGVGHSLVVLDRAREGQATGALDYGGNWRASTFIKGSPGRADPPPTDPVVLNEIVTHTDFLAEGDSNDWIELHNRGATDLVLGAGWYLSDSASDLTKWMIPANTVVPARGWISFDEITGFHTSTNAGFGLSKLGEQVFLSCLPGTDEDRVVDCLSFKAQENDFSFGRYPDGGACWFTLARTRDAANPAPPQPSIVISELMYHPPDVGGTNDNVAAEFVELHNPTSRAVELFNTNGGWRLNGGVEFDFPTNTVMPPHGVALVVSFDPTDAAALAAFRGTYGVSTSFLRVLGPYGGKLANRSDRVALEKPQHPDLPDEPVGWVIVDEVIYADQSPWPPSADGSGDSLCRVSTAWSGNDPANWSAAEPSPGEVDSSGRDRDGDGMPDQWELDHQLNPDSKADAATDLDGDGQSNLAEYLSGTDPGDRASVLRVESIAMTGDELTISFLAKADRTYSLLFTADLVRGAWTKFADVAAQLTDRTVTLTNSAPAAQAYYRLVTPSLP